MAEVTPLLSADPESVGPYRLEGRIGAGGQGAVYLGRDETGRRTAVKLLHAHLISHDVSRARFLDEVEIAKRVAPFCTAQVLDSGFLDDRPYIVSEYVDGPSLLSSVQESGVRDGAALERLALNTVTALAAIHRAGVVHRDFKPGNVILGPDGPVVIDFGIARPGPHPVVHRQPAGGHSRLHGARAAPRRGDRPARRHVRLGRDHGLRRHGAEHLRQRVLRRHHARGAPRRAVPGRPGRQAGGDRPRLPGEGPRQAPRRGRGRRPPARPARARLAHRRPRPPGLPRRPGRRGGDRPERRDRGPESRERKPGGRAPRPRAVRRVRVRIAVRAPPRPGRRCGPGRPDTRRGRLRPRLSPPRTGLPELAGGFLPCRPGTVRARGLVRVPRGAGRRSTRSHEDSTPLEEGDPRTETSSPASPASPDSSQKPSASPSAGAPRPSSRPSDRPSSSSPPPEAPPQSAPQTPVTLGTLSMQDMAQYCTAHGYPLYLYYNGSLTCNGNGSANPDMTTVCRWRYPGEANVRANGTTCIAYR